MAIRNANPHNAVQTFSHPDWRNVLAEASNARLKWDQSNQVSGVATTTRVIEKRRSPPVVPVSLAAALGPDGIVRPGSLPVGTYSVSGKLEGVTPVKGNGVQTGTWKILSDAKVVVPTVGTAYLTSKEFGRVQLPAQFSGRPFSAQVSGNMFLTKTEVTFQGDEVSFYVSGPVRNETFGHVMAKIHWLSA